MAKICRHYESKCSGEYKTLASRYVLQMGQEIRSQIDALLDQNEKNYVVAGCKSRLNLDEKNTFSSISNPTERIIEPCMRSSNQVKELENQVTELTNELKKTKYEMQRAMERSQETLNNSVSKYRERIKIEQIRFRKAQQSFEQRENQLKEEARLVNSFIRRKANEVIGCQNAEIEHLKLEMRTMIELYEEEVKESVRERLNKLEDGFRISVRKEKMAIERNVLSKSFSNIQKTSDKVSQVEKSDEKTILSEKFNSISRFSDESISTRKSSRSLEDRDFTSRLPMHHLKGDIRNAKPQTKEEHFIPQR